jgi:predicted nucleotidyltransferase
VEDLLGCPVDVVVEGGINPRLQARIHHEAQPL